MKSCGKCAINVIDERPGESSAMVSRLLMIHEAIVVALGGELPPAPMLPLAVATPVHKMHKNSPSETPTITKLMWHNQLKLAGSVSYSKYTGYFT